jgi:hypothetical protein
MHLTTPLLISFFTLSQAYPFLHQAQPEQETQPKLVFRSKHQIAQAQILHEKKTIISAPQPQPRAHAHVETQHILQQIQPGSEWGLDDGGVGKDIGKDFESGVVAKESRGVITMFAKQLGESVRMGFDFILANKVYEGGEACDDDSTGKYDVEGKLELRNEQTSTIEGGRDAAVLWLIGDLSRDLNDRYPQGIGYIGDELPHTLTTSSHVWDNHHRYTADMHVAISYAIDNSGAVEETEQGEDLDTGGSKENLMTVGDEWVMLLGLWKATASIVKSDILGKGKSFETLTLKGGVYGILFEVVWQFTEEECHRL